MEPPLPALRLKSPCPPKQASSPASGAARNFTGPLVYTVTAEDGTTQTYTVTVIVLPGDSYFTVTFYTDGGTPEPEPQVIAAGGTVMEPPPITKTGFAFTGWYTGADRVTPWDFAAAVTANLTLYAGWEAGNETPVHTVTFSADGGTPEPEPQVIAEGGTATEPLPVTNTGFVFAGWYTDADRTAAWDFAAAVTANLTLYAKWTDENGNPVHTVTFYAGGIPEPEPQVIAEGGTATEPLPVTKTGFVFDGWYTDADRTAAWDFAAAVTANLTLYAKWTDENGNPVHTVTFYADGGIPEPEPQVIAAGGTVTEPPSMTKTGFVFDDWYMDTDRTATWDFAAAAAVTEDLILYAKWERIADSSEDIGDFGAGAVIAGIFTVNNLDEWNAALNAINGGGGGTTEKRKNYVVNIAADIAVPGNNKTFSVPYIAVSLRGAGRTLSLSGNRAMLVMGSYTVLVLRDLTLRGHADNTDPLICFDEYFDVVMDMKGTATITGNEDSGTGASAIWGESYRHNDTIYGLVLTMRDNATITGNASYDYTGEPIGSAVAGGKTIVMEDNAAISGNIGWGISGIEDSIIMRDYARIDNNSGDGIRGNTVIMEDNASVSGNGGMGISGYNVAMSGNATVSYNGGGGIWINSSPQGSITMQDYASVSNNTLNYIVRIRL
jgi:uncharacterized repeat protein (TIGR02543 family)